MNRFVSLLLAAVSLAQPAQAQWVKGQAYFGTNNSQNSAAGTTITATLNTNKASNGHVNITATPGQYPYYSTSGNYGGSVGVNYVWTGGTLTQAMVLSTTQSLEATGASNGGANGNSNAGGQQAYGDFSHSPGWDSTASPSFTHYFSAGATPPTQTQTVSLGATVSASYNSSMPGSSIVTADVTFGDPVVTH